MLTLLVAAHAQCKGDGKDFSGMDGKTLTGFETLPVNCDNTQNPVVYTFTTSVCQNSISCGTSSSMTCQTNNCGNPATVISTNVNILWTATPLGATWVTNTGDATGCTANRQATYVWICDATLPESIVVTEPASCTYNLAITTDCTQGAKTGRMSGGTIFLIILLCVIPVYLGVGILYNWKLKGKALGKESIPNIEFWTDLPNLIKEGFYFVKGKVCKSKGGEQYDEL